MSMIWMALLMSLNISGWEGHFSRGEWSESLQEAVVALEADSSDADAWAALSFSQSVLQMNDEALTSAERALLEDSSSAMAWGALGRALFTVDTEAAAEAYGRSLDIDPVMPLSSAGLAHIHVLNGDCDQASELLDSTLGSEPSWISLWLEKAYVLEYLEDYHQADLLVSEALARWPDNYQLLLEHAWIMEMLGKYVTAEEIYRRIAALNEDDTEGMISLGLMFESLGQYGRAVKVYREAGDRDPDNSWILGEIGLCLESVGSLSAAAASYEQGLEIDPGYSFSAYRLGYLAEGEGDTEGALEWYAGCVEADPSFTKAWISMGLIYESLADYEAAESAYRSALEQDPGASWTWGELGAVLEQLGRFEEAGEAYETGVALSPDYLWAWHQRGILLENSGDMEAAAEWYLLATERTEVGSWLLGELGYVLEHLEMPDSASVFYDQAIAKDSSYMFGMMRLAPIEAAAGRTDHSLELWDMYLAAGGDESTALTEKVLLLEAMGSESEADSLSAVISSEYPSAWVDMAYRRSATDPELTLELCARAEEDGLGDDAMIWTDLAVLYGAMEEHELAQAAFGRAAELSPEETDVWYEWGFYLFNEDLEEEAAEKYMAIVALDSLSFEGWSSLGEAYLFAEDYGEAADALNMALELNPTSQWVLAYMGLVYEQTGYPDKALDYYFQSLSVSPGYDYTETRIREITDTDFDPEWNRQQSRRLNIFIYADTRAENGNIRERQYTAGAEVSYDYDGKGSLVSIEADYSLRETEESHLSDYTWASARLSLERVMTDYFTIEASSYWDRQPGTVRPWQISSYFSLGYNRQITDWLWTSPTLGMGLVNTHWSSGYDSKRSDIVTVYGSTAVWVQFDDTSWPSLWLTGDFYIPPDNPDALMTSALAELSFDVWQPVSITLGYSVSYTREPFYSYWEKYDTEVYSRLNVRVL